MCTSTVSTRKLVRHEISICFISTIQEFPSHAMHSFFPRLLKHSSDKLEKTANVGKLKVLWLEVAKVHPGQEVSCIPRCDRKILSGFGFLIIPSMPACNDDKKKLSQVLQLKSRTNTHHLDHAPRECKTSTHTYHVLQVRRSHGHPLPGALGCVENQRIAGADLHKRRENQQVCNQLGKHNFILILDVCMLFHMICVVSHRFLSCQVYYSMLQLPRQEFDKSVALLLSSCSARPAACLFLLGPSSGLEVKENHPDV